MARVVRIFCLYLALWLQSGVATTAQQSATIVENGNPEMAAAIAQARATLPALFDFLDRNPNGRACVGLKVAIEGPEAVEHLWVSGLEPLPDGRIAARLDNTPGTLASLKLGDAVVFSYDQITDWNLVMEGRGFGFYTLRAMLPVIEPKRAAALRAFLSDVPLPAGW